MCGMERICFRLQRSGRRLPDTPFSMGWKLYDSSRFGPDNLMRWKASNELCYFEFKWWERFPKVAVSDARRQALANLRDYPFYHGRRVTRSFAAILDWDSRYLAMSVLVRQIV
jgi:hypothetical protein